MSVTSASTGPLWGLVDQGLYSGTNFIAIAVVARMLGPAGFGAFALVLAVWATLWVLGRSVLAEPFSIRASRLAEDGWLREASRAVTAIGGVGLLLAAVLAAAAIGLPIGDDGSATLLVLAAFVPVLLLQDFWRVAAFSQQRGALAALNDGTWAVVQIAGFALLLALDAFSAPTALAAWAVGAAAGCAVAWARFRVPFAPLEAGRRWLRDALRLGGWFGAAWGAGALAIHAVYMIVAWSASLAALGGLSSMYTLYGPLGTLYRGMQLPALPSLARASSGSILPIVARYTAGLLVIAVLYGAALVLLGDQVVRLLYGAAFLEYTALLLPIGLVFLAIALSGVLSLALRAQEVRGPLLAVEAVSALLHVTLAFTFLRSFGLIGVPWAHLIASVTNVALLGAALERTRRERRAAPVVAPARVTS